MLKRFISSLTVAEVLGVSIRTVERLKREGRDDFPKPAVRHCGFNFYDPQEIETFKAANARILKRTGRTPPPEIFLEV